jgi:hypothetical protein
MTIMNCKFCNGTGKIGDAFAGYKPCGCCKGAGEFDIQGDINNLSNCKFCNGTGKIGDAFSGYRPCPSCKGLGLLERPIVRIGASSNQTETPRTPRPHQHKYDIALSFAGEDRSIARKYADLLLQKGISVFYDEYEQAGLWGKDLYEKLDSIYRLQARFCVVFISKSYAKKLWTNHERKSAQARAFKENEEYILPVRLDDTEIPGIRDTTGYLDLRHLSLEQLVQLTENKLK